MKTLIIEDEKPAAKRLARLLAEHCPSCEILEVLESVDAATNWVRQYPAPDLVFMDIQLADGLSFDIFSKTEVSAPVIFTTAFDQYTLRAFKVNSVDYLLKPIDPDELKLAIEKYRRYFQKKETYDPSGLEKMLKEVVGQPGFKKRFLVKSGQHMTYVRVEEVAYFFSEDGLSFLQTFDGKRNIVGYTLDQLEEMVDAQEFFRINRQVLVHLGAVKKISTWFNSRLKLNVEPWNELNFVVSRERVGTFKQWLGGE